MELLNSGGKYRHKLGATKFKKTIENVRMWMLAWGSVCEGRFGAMWDGGGGDESPSDPEWNLVSGSGHGASFWFENPFDLWGTVINITIAKLINVNLSWTIFFLKCRWNGIYFPEKRSTIQSMGIFFGVSQKRGCKWRKWVIVGTQARPTEVSTVHSEAE